MFEQMIDFDLTLKDIKQIDKTKYHPSFLSPSERHEPPRQTTFFTVRDDFCRCDFVYNVQGVVCNVHV